MINSVMNMSRFLEKSVADLKAVAELGTRRLRSTSGVARVWMDPNSASGSTTSDLDGTDDPSDGAAIELRASSSKGDIRMRRAASASGHQAARP